MRTGVGIAVTEIGVGPREVMIVSQSDQEYKDRFKLFKEMGIDPNEFVVPACDDKGHSGKAFCRLQPGHDRLIDVIVSTGIFPYKTKSDFIRHALMRHLRWCQGLVEMGKEIPSMMKQVDIILELVRGQIFQQEFGDVMMRLGEAISAALAAGAQGEAIRLLAFAKKQIEDMPEGYWRDRYLREVKDRWGHILR